MDMLGKPEAVMDLSKIDFETLNNRIKQSKRKNNLEVLNAVRADFAEKFEELIESYDSGSQNIEELCEELLKLSRGLSEEQRRGTGHSCAVVQSRS